MTTDAKLTRRWVAARAQRIALRRLAALHPQSFRALYVEAWEEVFKAEKASRRFPTISVVEQLAPVTQVVTMSLSDCTYMVESSEESSVSESIAGALQ